MSQNTEIISGQFKNFKSYIIQALVQNYLEKEYHDVSVFIYPEIVNDIDIFSRQLLSRNTNFRNGKHELHAFIDTYEDDYIKTIEVKNCEHKYFKLQYLVDLISKMIIRIILTWNWCSYLVDFKTRRSTRKNSKTLNENYWHQDYKT